MKKSHLSLALIICFLCLLGSSESEFSSQWTPQLSAEWRQRSQAAIKFFAGKNYGSTAFENEKRSYPRAMIDFLAGNQKKAIAFLQSEDADAQGNAHTLGIDFYSGFTNKGQVRKYFYFGKYLDKSYC